MRQKLFFNLKVEVQKLFFNLKVEVWHAFFVAVFLLMPMGLFSQSYNDLWKQVRQAQDKDLPKTAISHLEKIEKKAQREQAYGQIMRSTLLHADRKSVV